MPVNCGSLYVGSNLGLRGQVEPTASQNYDSFYSQTLGSFSYDDVYDSSGFRRKRASITLIDSSENVGKSFVIPKIGQVFEFWQDARPTNPDGTDSTTQNPANLLFRGVIVKDPIQGIGVYTPSGGTQTNVYTYRLEMEGYDTYTIDFDLITARYVSRTASYILKDILTVKGENPPAWLTVIDGNIGNYAGSGSPVIALANFVNKHRSEIIANLVKVSGWEFFIADNGIVYFYDATQGSIINDFAISDVGDMVTGYLTRNYVDASFKIESSDRDAINEAVIIGQPTPGKKVFDHWKGNKVTGNFPLTEVPYGLKESDWFIDKFSGTVIGTQWTQNPSPVVGITQGLGRLQILTTGVNILISTDVFHREDYVEFKISEIEMPAVGGNLTFGFHSGVNSTSVGEFKQAITLQYQDASTAVVAIQEGATPVPTTYTIVKNPPGGSNVYSIRIRLKSGGGAIYYLQGGVWGTLGTKTWTRIGETSADTTAYMAAAIRADNAVNATLINCFVTKRIQIKVTVQDQGTPAEREILVGTAQSQDASIEAFVDVSQGNPELRFYASDDPNLDTRPLGRVRAIYNSIGQVRESIYSTPNITRIRLQSGLATSGDTGLRKDIIQTDPLPDQDNDALRYGVEILRDRGNKQYRGTFQTNSLLTTVAPQAGGRVTINVKGIVTTQVMTRVAGHHEGFHTSGSGHYMIYDVEFGGLSGFTQQQLALKARQKIVIDDNTPTDPIRRSEAATALGVRIGMTDNVSGVYGRTNIQLNWTPDPSTDRLNTEVRLDEYFGTGGTQMVYKGTGSSVILTPGGGTPAGFTLPARRSYTFYLRELDASGTYSYRSSVCRVDNPAPIPRPMKDLQSVIYKGGVVYFNPEYEDDLIKRRVYWSADPNFQAATANVCDAGITDDNFTFHGPAARNVYVKYSLWDDWTSLFRDEVFTGERVLRLTSDTGPPSQVRNLKCQTRASNCTDQDVCVTAGNQNIGANLYRLTWNPPSANADSINGYLVYVATGVGDFLDITVRDNFWVAVDPCSQIATAYPDASTLTPLALTASQYKDYALKVVSDVPTSGVFPDVGAGTMARMINDNTAGGLITMSELSQLPKGRYPSQIMKIALNNLPQDRWQIIWLTPAAFRGALPIVSVAEFEAPNVSLYGKVIAFNRYGSTGKIVGPCFTLFASDEAPSGALDYTTAVSPCSTKGGDGQVSTRVPGVLRNFSVVSGTGWGDVYASMLPPLVNWQNIQNIQLAYDSTSGFTAGDGATVNLGNQLYTPVLVGINKKYFYRVRAQNLYGFGKAIDNCGTIYDCITGTT